MGPREQRMIDLGFSPECNLKAGAIYRPVVIDGTTAYVAGCVPFDENQQLTSRGKVPSEVSLADAQKAAALCAAMLQSQTPVFRGSTEVVVVDVQITDRA